MSKQSVHNIFECENPFKLQEDTKKPEPIFNDCDSLFENSEENIFVENVTTSKAQNVKLNESNIIEAGNAQNYTGHFDENETKLAIKHQSTQKENEMPTSIDHTDKENANTNIPIVPISNKTEETIINVPNVIKNNDTSMHSEIKKNKTTIPSKNKLLSMLNENHQENISFLKSYNDQEFYNSVQSLEQLKDFIYDEKKEIDVKDNIEDLMDKKSNCADLQTLLSLFGIPTYTAPFEAEAQCSYLEQIGVAQGVVTEDSDSFLFGAKNVYRHFLEDGITSHLYSIEYIEEQSNINRDIAIMLSLLLGSDYTLGVHGIGPVNAMEILSIFTSFEQLTKLKQWSETMDDVEFPNEDDKIKEFKEKHKNLKKYWHFPSAFPDKRVIQSYSDPLVDTKLPMFDWKTPKFDEIEQLVNQNVQQGRKEVLYCLNILKQKYAEHFHQTTIEQFLKPVRVANYKSKRLITAIDRMKEKEEKGIQKMKLTDNRECLIDK